MRRLHARDSGTAIIAVLVFMLLLGVISIAIANYAFTTFKAADVTIEVTDEVSSQSEVLDESIAFLREATGGEAARCANPPPVGGGAPPTVVFAMQDVRQDKWLRVECTFEEAVLSEDLAPDFSAIILGDSGTGPFLELNGRYDVPFRGDIVLKHPSPDATEVCLEELPDIGCETDVSGGNAGRIVLTEGKIKSVTTDTRSIPIQKIVDASGVPVAWELDPGAADPDPHWNPPDTNALPAGGFVLSGCRNEGFTFLPRVGYKHSCIRAYQPGHYPNQLNFRLAQPSGAMDNGLGTCADSGKYCVIRTNWLKPGVYKLERSLVVAETSDDALVVGGTLRDPNNPQLVAAQDRCVVGQPGVALVFAPPRGIHHHDALPGYPTADITLCHVTPEQLVNASGVVQGQPGLAVYQEPDSAPGALGQFAILSSECILGANGALVVHGMVYAPEGRIFVCTGHSTNNIKVGTGVVAWSLKVAAYDLADYNFPVFGPTEGGSSSETGVAYERTLHLTVQTCSDTPGPSPDFDCAVESEVTADLKIGYDADVSAWISKYLPGGE